MVSANPFGLPASGHHFLVCRSSLRKDLKVLARWPAGILFLKIIHVMFDPEIKSYLSETLLQCALHIRVLFKCKSTFGSL